MPIEMMTSSLAERLGDATLARRLVEEAPPMWLKQRDIDAVMNDLALLAPPPGPGELRVRILPLDLGEQTWSLTLVAADRPGLLAMTAAVCSGWDLDIRAASVASWMGLGIALQQVTLRAAVTIEDEPDWVGIGQALRAALDGGPVPDPAFRPGGAATVEIRPDEPGRWWVSVQAPDRVGLLAAITGWLRDAGAEVEAAAIVEHDGLVEDGFMVLASPDFGRRAPELARALS